MPYIEVAKENTAPVELYYEDHGSGKPVLLIHGFPFDGGAWEKETLALLEAGYRVLTYDRRGFGKSSKPTVGYDYDTFTKDLDTLLTKLDLNEVALVGHSMGTGEVTRYLGTVGPKRISKAVLISPIPPFLLKTPDNPEGVDKSVFNGLQQQIMADRFTYLSAFIHDFYNTDQNLGKSISQEAVDNSWNVASVASPRGTYECVDTWQTDFRNDVPGLSKVPLMVIQGDQDRILPYASTGKRLADILPDSKHVVLKGAPHGIPWTHAAEINRELLSFLGDKTV